MDVDIQSLHFELTREIKVHIQRKLQFALSRMEPYVLTVSVTLSDVNNSKGESEKYCELQITIANMEDVVIKETQTDLYCVIDRAMQRASRVVARRIGRRLR